MCFVLLLFFVILFLIQLFVVWYCFLFLVYMKMLLSSNSVFMPDRSAFFSNRTVLSFYSRCSPDGTIDTQCTSLEFSTTQTQGKGPHGYDFEVRDQSSE